MSKLCLSTYLSVLILYKRSKTIKDCNILQGLVRCISTNTEIIEAIEGTITSHIKNGGRNLSLNIRDEIEKYNYQTSDYLGSFMTYVSHLLHPGKTLDIYKTLRYIAMNDNDIDEECIIDPISKTKKSDLNYKGDYISFIAGVFLYVSKLDNDKTAEYASEITKEFCENAVEEYSTLTNVPMNFATPNEMVRDSDIPSQARAFCRKYESYIGLLPLCQIANIVAPHHNHINKMYSEYGDCSNKLQRQIMQEKNIPMINIDSDALYDLIGHFIDDMETLGLASHDKTYIFSKWFASTLDFEKYMPNDINPTIFPLVPSKIIPWQKTSTLSRFIQDYLDYKGTDKALPTPFDWMWYYYDFANCDIELLIFGVNLFIINSCYMIDKPTDNLSEKKERIAMCEPYNLKTLADIHFFALLQLYDTYMCK